MGSEAVWVPLALAAVGAGTSYYNTQQTAKRQDNALADQIRQQNARQAEADAQVNNLVQKRATSDASTERAQTLGAYLDQVRAATGAATSGLGQVGKVSDAYQQAANDAALGVADYGQKSAQLMSRIDAPTQQRQREALQNAQFQTDLGLIKRNAAGDDYLAKLRLQRIRENPWLSAASQLATSAAASSAASGGFGSAGSSAGSAANFGSEAGNWYTNPALWGA
ncbi:hypothetical protein NG831_06565 [Xanthomonas sacchari]|uniref:hypothetical protein n=1 Tax=Xanthomonas sacchari TaxID=56458 RepID=UPI002256A2F8|nr:hypothetical protein [Xanthomonas sacchari]MCW0413476.1 hypothetical protein [Xanthomonas sacchari]UYK67823.1 hypothetical protein NG831_06565 [Xanthomonas sacchari]